MSPLALVHRSRPTSQAVTSASWLSIAVIAVLALGVSALFAREVLGLRPGHAEDAGDLQGGAGRRRGLPPAAVHARSRRSP